MKVRHKQNICSVPTTIYDVLEESAHFYIVYQGVGAGQMLMHALPKADYEPVPTETWRDVTAECEWDGRDMFCGLNFIVAKHDASSDRYRLRKVVIETGAQGEPPYRYAFIVQKREL
jgi:hypothetical protein